MQYDILIVGSGLTGASLGVALINKGFKVAILDRMQPPHSPTPPRTPDSVEKADARAIALSYGSTEYLSTLGFSETLSRHSTRLMEVQVSEKGHFGVARIRALKNGLPYLGCVIPADVLSTLLYQTIKEQSEFDGYWGTEITELNQSENGWTLQLNTGEILQTSLLVGADGSESYVRKQQGVDCSLQAFSHKAIVVSLKTTLAYQSIAFERFLQVGSIAMLPLKEGWVKCIWITSESECARLMQFDDSDFLKALQAAFGYRLGMFEQIGQKTIYPLRQTSADNIYGLNWVLIGNAANMLHPIAAQGFNLGLRDIAILVEQLEKTRAVDKIGSIEFLRTYANARHADHARLRWFTRQLVEGGMQRRFGILACEFISSVQSWVSQIGCGLHGDLPECMRGVKAY